MKISSKDNNIWFTSDLHFGHKRIIEFCPNTRSYISVEEMNNDIINKWNSQVSDKDIVFILGDVSFAKEDVTLQCLSQLNGNLYLVTGNHDKGLPLQRFERVYNNYAEIKIDNVDVVMCHYPIYEWNKMRYGSYHLYGHVHGKPIPVTGRLMDVGWDVKGELFSWEQIVEHLEPKLVREHGGKYNGN